MEESAPLSYIELSRSNLIHNFRLFRALLAPRTKIACVVKANAYGHGMREVVHALEGRADYFQIDDIEELEALRTVSHAPAFLFGYVPMNALERAVSLGAEFGVYDEPQIRELEAIALRSGKKPRVHIKIDAHLGRQGILPDRLNGFIRTLKRCSNLEVVGAYSHFSNIEDTADFSHAEKQLEAFRKAVEEFRKAGFPNIATHISATSGMLVYERGTGAHEIARLGIGLYGLWPSEELGARYRTENFELKPALRWVTHIAQVKEVPARFPIGYGLTYITPKPMTVAVIPQGYSDGYDRGLSNIGEVLIRGTRSRILGRVAMNMFVVDVSHIPDVKAEDEAVLLGSMGTERVCAEEIAKKLNTINYEVVARISPLLPRRML